MGVGTGWITLVNNSLTGMGHQVKSGEADISISASEVLPYRAKSLQFLHPTYYTKYKKCKSLISVQSLISYFKCIH